MHTHEVVAQLTRWWDDEVFEKYPSWDEFKAGNFTNLNAESYFSGEGDIGGRNYAQCVKYGIGREVIAKMLEGTETEGNIKLAELARQKISELETKIKEI